MNNTGNGNVDPALVGYARLHPVSFGPLVRLSIDQSAPRSGEIADVTLRMELAPHQGGRRRLRLTFHGVMDLCLRPPGFPIQFSLIEIHPNVDRPCEEWETLRYKVVESEDLSLSFYCRSFEATIAES